MKFGENGELIISGKTEALVAAHYLDDLKIGSLERMVPPLVPRRIGYFAFVGSRIGDLFGTNEHVEHVAPDAGVALKYAELLTLCAMPLLPFRPARLGRRSFLLKRLPRLSEQPE